MNQVDARLLEIADSFAAEKFAADFVVGGVFAFQQGNGASRGGEAESDHGTGKAAADDKVVGRAGGVGH